MFRRYTNLPLLMAGGGGGGGASLPSLTAGASANTDIAYGFRATTENGSNGIGGRTTDQVWLFVYFAYGSGWGSTGTNGYTNTFEADWSIQKLWQGNSSDGAYFMAIHWGIPPADVGTTDTLNLTSAGSASDSAWAGSYALRINTTPNQSEVAVWGTGGDSQDWYNTADGAVGDHAPTISSGNIIAPSSLSNLPANVTTCMFVFGNDNSTITNANWEFDGINTTTGTDRTHGMVTSFTGLTDYADTDNVWTTAATAQMISPVIVIPGPAA